MLRFNYKVFWFVFQMFALWVVFHPAVAQDRPAPEASTQTVIKQGVNAHNFMAVTANPLATAAAYGILANGGTAADAAIAAQLVLGLTEPQSSGLGGGAFVIYYDKAKNEITSWDARETAPQNITPQIFQNPDGTKMDFMEAVIGGRSVGVPGTPALLHRLYKEYGRLPSAQLFAPAIKLAEHGFQVSPRLAALIAEDKGKLDTFPAARAYFYHEDGTPLAAGEVLKNPAYADTLRQFRDRGVGWFYKDAGKDIAATVREAGGGMNAADLIAYEVKQRRPVCGLYRAYKICSMAEPSSGGLTLLSILGMLERFDLGAGPVPANIHLIAEASRLAFADRNEYMADPDKVKTPGEALIDPAYLQSRSALIDPQKAQTDINAGNPDHEKGTSQITIADSYGNILSMTTTIESAFGSKLMTHGFLLNNELTDFNFEDGTANSPAPGKRPRSSMSPAIVFDPQGAPFLAIGSAGGSQIIGFVAQRIIAVIDWHMDIQEALAMPNMLARSDTVELEAGTEDLKTPLEKMGHAVEVKDINSGLTAIRFNGALMTGAADPRREGEARGE